MKPTLDFDEKLLNNEGQFQNEFFKRFKLRHARQPLQLNDQISKDYLFPTFYSDVTCAIGIFMCSYEKARQMMPHPAMVPVKMTKGRSLVVFSCYEYKNVLGITPYNEIAMTIPVMVAPKLNVPVLPMVSDSFKEFGYYVFLMPVTSLENKIRGNKIWGLPKDVHEIDIHEEGRDCVTVCMEKTGEPFFELRVPIDGKATGFDVTSNLYSVLDNELLQSETNFKASFNVNKNMGLLFKKEASADRQYLKLYDTPTGRILKNLEIEEAPFQLRFAKHMSSCFDLANPDYKLPGNMRK